MTSVPTLESPIEPREKKRRILILEDDCDLLELLKDAFEVYGFEVHNYSDPDQAVKTFTTDFSYYDVALMDMKLGSIDGRLIYKKFKEQDSNFKIFVLTGLELNIEQFKEICPSFEQKFLIKKPVKISALIDIVKSIL